MSPMLNRCDCCCECGIWCADGSCGNTQGWQGTNSGAADAGSCGDCGNFNVTYDHSDFQGSIAAEQWNEGRANYLADNGVAMAGVDAKAGTRVCQWARTTSPLSACSAASWTAGLISIYQADDGKWHRYATATMQETQIAVYDGDTLLNGTGDSNLDCGDPDAPATTISDTITWAYSYTVGGGAEPTWAYCNPPTTTIFENIPGGAV